jgi:hypothetical protein
MLPLQLNYLTVGLDLKSLRVNGVLRLRIDWSFA